MKVIIQIVLWVVVGFLGYLIYDSIETPIEFQKIKKERYLPVVNKLKEVRKAELAYEEVTGRYAGTFESLIQFIDTAQFVITERRDTSYLDEAFKRTYGVDKYIQDVNIDTLGYISVKDSLFGNSTAYKNLMYVPNTDPQATFELAADSLYSNETYIPVFEAKVDKALLLKGLDENLVKQERKIQSVDEISGAYIKVGDMTKVNTNGNWPKNYGELKK